MKRMRLFIFIVLTLSVWMASAQEIYRWVDEKGIIHFADDFTLVPEKYRDQIQKRKSSEKPSPPTPRIPKRPEPSETTESAPEQKDLLGRGEDWWRAKVKEWNDKLFNAQKNYDHARAALRAKEKELEDSKFKPDSLKRRLKAEIKELEGKVKEREREKDEAGNMVEKILPKQAEDNRADPAWLKPKEQ
ncbi:MAG: DUF4124 domain-containing protein [Thermodesulfobacteriota bacterium]|nr:DUF4124 domain-containing protein [Thermodesulfobacteriota bacterium]